MPPAPPRRTRGRATSQSACVPRGMPGARSGGTGGDSSQSGGYSGDASGAVTVWEVVSLLGKLLGTVAALKVVLYLLRVCLAMAWKSGGASHSELIHNLRSKCHPRPMWGNWARLGLDWVPLGRPERPVCPPPAPPPISSPVPAGGFGAGLHQQPRTACAGDRLPQDLSLIGDVDAKGKESYGLLLVGPEQASPRGPGGGVAAQVVGLSLESAACSSGSGGRGACPWGGEMLAGPGGRAASEGTPPSTPASSRLPPPQ